eukprot:TRINITY_DN70574_c0_g1_i1.p1 TRINITY_DN70574_c0_g1~~TRINITY_DN70574_c0_g1_i1.p1  ORF type:complete len:1758 (+),score=493.97 TRINITY_DN70574_c0_g1_i1:111-5276(+)
MAPVEGRPLLARPWRALPPYIAEGAAATRDAGYASVLSEAKAVLQSRTAGGGICTAAWKDKVGRPLTTLMDCRLWPGEDECRELVEAFVAALSAGGRDYRHLADCCQLIDRLVRSRCPVAERDAVPGLTVDHGVFIALVDRLWFTKCRMGITPGAGIDKHLGNALLKLSPYFSEGAAEAAWARYRPLICPHNEQRMFRAWSALLHLLPARQVSQEMVDDIVALWSLHTGLVWTNELLRFLSRVADAQVAPGVLGAPRASVAPHAGAVYSRVLKALRAAEQGQDSQVLLMGKSSGAFKKTRTANMGGALVAALVRLQWDSGDAELAQLSQLLRALDHFLGPCDDSSHLFVASLARGLLRQVRDARRLSGGPPIALCGEEEEDDAYWLRESDAEDDDEDADGVPVGVDAAAAPSAANGHPAQPAPAAAEEEAPLLQLRHRACELLLPHCITMLMNQKAAEVATTGGRLAATLMQMHPEQAVSAVLSRAKANAEVRTSSVGTNAALFRALLPQLLRNGDEESQRWLLGRVAELIDPAHTRLLTAALQCVLFTCAAVRLQPGWQAAWGEDVARRLVALGPTVENPAFVTMTSQLLCAALPQQSRDIFCEAVSEHVRLRLHGTQPGKNMHLRVACALARSCAAACPEWGARFAAQLQQRILSAPHADAGDAGVSVQWAAHILAKVSGQLGPKLLPLLGEQTKVIERLLFQSGEAPQWRIKAGGSVLKYTVRGLTELHPVGYGQPAGCSAEAGGALRVRRLSYAEQQVAWHCPSDAELAAAVGLINRWGPEIVRRVGAAERWRHSGAADAPDAADVADAARLVYIAKAAALFYREQLAAECKGDPFLRGVTSERRAAAAAQLAVGWREAAEALARAPRTIGSGLTDWAGASLARVAAALLDGVGRWNRTEMLYHAAAGSVLRMAGVLGGGSALQPLCALRAAQFAWRAECRLPAARSRLTAEADLLLSPLVALCGCGLEGTRRDAKTITEHVLTRHALPLAARRAAVAQACGLLAGVCGAEEPTRDAELAALGGLSLLSAQDVVADVWRDWESLRAVCRTAVPAALSAKDDVRKSADGLITALYSPGMQQLPRSTAGGGSAAEARELLTELVAGCAGTGPAVLLRSCRLVTAICTRLPSGDAVPPGLYAFLLHNLADGQKEVRCNCRSALGRVLCLASRPPPRRTVPCTERCTTTRTVPALVKEYDYSAPAEESPAAREVADCLDDDLLGRLLTVDEQNQNDMQEELREVRTTFDWEGAQVWKGIFQIAGLRGGAALLQRVDQHPAMGEEALDRGNSRQQAELAGGLLRAMRHWRREGDAAARAAGFELVRRRTCAAASDGRLSALKDFGEALCHGVAQQPDLGPLEPTMLDLLGEAAGMQQQARAVEIVARCTGGLQRHPSHIAFAHRLIAALKQKQLSLEYRLVRDQVCVLGAYLFNLLFTFPPQADPELGGLVDTFARLPDGVGAKVVLGCVASTTALGRVISLEPYFPAIVRALSFAVTERQSHSDGDEELAAMLGSAVRGFFLGGFSVAPLVAMLPLVPAELLGQRRGRKMVLVAAELVALNAFDALTHKAVQQALLTVLGSLLRGLRADASRDASAAVASLVRAAEPAFGADLLAQYAEWARSEQVGLRKGAAAGLGGVAAARTYAADETTWSAVQGLLALCKDSAQPVRARASEYAAGWRQTVRENPLVWRDIEPKLKERDMLQPLLAVQSAAPASFAYA